MSFKRAIARTPVLGPAVLFAHRARTAARYFRRQLADLVRWLFHSRETTNFTYELDDTNKRYLAALLAEVTDLPFAVLCGYIAEIEADLGLRRHVADLTRRSDFAFEADPEVRFGRRVGWYALVRALKPATVVETGVDKGLGACVLAAALKRNDAEGCGGRYFGTDIDPDAGYLLAGDYARYGRILYGDSLESLQRFDGAIDLFINDSDHSAEYEAQEYRAVAAKLSERAVVLGDNCHVTGELLEFSLRAGRRFVFFQEKPRGHWYPGAGIGISFRRPDGR